ncbi:MAG: YggS family pyridoxal phosphate-dependent enzyme [Thermomicrobiales bacterium]|nr:YggS family pyridoxal phosphate-dependent enzyme [Thermomicrobiales bacterium]
MIGSLQDNALALRARVTKAAERAHRDPDSVTIVAVSKGFPRAAVDAAYEAGFRVFGENRVQEIREKYAFPCPADAQVHFIGSLQTNKITQVLPYVQVIETVDRPELVRALQRQLEKHDRVLPVMLQINISGEVQKSGVAPDAAMSLLEDALAAPHIAPVGLMTMAPLDADESMLRSVFGGLRILRDELQERTGHVLPALSMGMSSDFEIAIAEGATHVRLGRALFGERR